MQPVLVLTPVQQEAANSLLEGISVGGVLVLRGQSGSGKTVVLKNIHAAKGGVIIGVRESSTLSCPATQANLKARFSAFSRMPSVHTT